MKTNEPCPHHSIVVLEQGDKITTQCTKCGKKMKVVKKPDHTEQALEMVSDTSTERERILANALDKAIEMGAKAEAEVERLRVALQSCYWATNTYDGNYTRACDNVATIAIEALKTQDK
jgi:predicted  nucleic acid-binding Zn-ribbon protein